MPIEELNSLHIASDGKNIFIMIINQNHSHNMILKSISEL